MKIKILNFLGYLTAISWILSGIVTIGSIYLSSIGIFINIFGGLLFILFGMYFIWKCKALLQFLNENQNTHTKVYEKVVTAEILFYAIASFIGSVMLGAIISRVFIENFAVFG